VIVDAARQPWSLEDLREIVNFLSSVEGLNLLHLRLSDDQGFVLILDDTHPELSSVYWDSGENNSTEVTGTFTASEMREFVAYADSRGVFVVPELNVPGHAGGWWRSGLLVNCPKYACESGWSLPLDVRRPEAVQLVAKVFAEIRGIFSNAPFYHLGGDEIRSGDPCWKEAQSSEMLVDLFWEKKFGPGSGNRTETALSKDDLVQMEHHHRGKLTQFYASFEASLEQQSAPGVPSDRVMRWEAGRMNAATRNGRFGRATHFWMSSPKKKLETEAEEDLLVKDRAWMKSRRRQALERQRKRRRDKLKRKMQDSRVALPPAQPSFWERLWAKKGSSDVDSASHEKGVGKSEDDGLVKDEDILDRLIFPPFFISSGLYFDRPNGGDSGYDVYQRTIEFLLQGATGVIAGAFELDKQSWRERNVWGKLIAIAVALRRHTSIVIKQENISLGLLGESAFRREYTKLCSGVAELGQDVCALFGEPAILNSEWLARYNKELDPSVRARQPVCDAVTRRLSLSELSLMRPVPRLEDLRIMRSAANSTNGVRMAVMHELWSRSKKELGLD
jgi:hypothetical protein